MINQKTIDQVLDKANIVDIVSDYVQLSKAGVNYKGLCPFHTDHNPSFVVSPGKNICHCFSCGKGGNPINFIMAKESMPFTEAVKHLAKKYNIQIEEDHHQYTDKEREEQSKKESLEIVYSAVTEFYFKQLHSNTSDSKAALDYVNKRWNGAEEKVVQGTKVVNFPEKNFPDLARIGFASSGWDNLVQFSMKNGYSLKLMEDVGLIKISSKGTYIDVFRNRIMIPWRDRWGKVRGFTARKLSEDSDAPKYINSKESFYFHKGSTIFGFDLAKNAGAREEKFYLVEGNPDVMKLQSLDIDNTIAPGGTAWTHDEYEQLKKFHATLCFIPDADDPGIKAVMKNGRKAVQEGFRVTVKEIPRTKDGKKQDADSYIKSRAMLNELDEVDYIEWISAYNLRDVENTSELTDKIGDICNIIIDLEEDVQQTAMLEKLGTKYGHKNIWKQGLKRAKELRLRKKTEAISKKGDIDLLQKYGFYEMANCYYSNQGDNTIQWSNFTMKPLFHIKDSFNAKRIYELKNYRNHTELIELKTEELISLPKFKQRIESLGDFLWLVSDRELNKLKSYLYENTETAVEIKQLGWAHDGFFVWGNGIYDAGSKFLPVDEYGIVRVEKNMDDNKQETDNYYLPAMSKIYADERELYRFERQFIFDEDHSSISLHDYAKMTADVFGNNGKVGIMFLLATLFRDVIVSNTKNFPILNLFGPKGSGKTELGHTLMSFFIKNNTPLNIQNATIAALADAIAQCSNALVHIDEYKNTIDPVKVEFLKGLYDGAGRSRMNMDLDKKRQITSVDSAVILSGQEMPTVDIALFSRTIYLTFDVTVHDKESKDKFNSFTAVRKMGVCHLTNQILSHRAKFETEFYDNYQFVTKDVEQNLVNNEIEDRIWRDWCVLLASFYTLKDVVDLPWTYNELRDITIEGIKKQNKECASSNEMGNFWSMIGVMAQAGMIDYDGDYKIKYLDGIKTKNSEMLFTKNKPVLMIRPNKIITQYKIMAKKAGENAMPERSIRYYLQTCPGFLGQKKGSERFKVFKDGKIQKIWKGEGDQQKSIDLCTFDNPLCFDYQELKQKFEINLEVNSSEGEYPEEIEDKNEGNLPF